MDRLNRNIESQIKCWIFQKEHFEIGSSPIYASYDSSQLLVPPVREHIKGSADEQLYSRF